MGKKRLGDLLRESQLVDEEQLRAALEVHRSTGERLGSTLLRLDLVEPQLLADLLGQQLEVDGIDPLCAEPMRGAVELLSFTQAMRFGCLPLWVDHGALGVAMADPTDAAVIEELKELTNPEIEPLVAPQMALFEAVKRAYGKSSKDDLDRERLKKVARSLRNAMTLVDQLLAE